MPDISVNIDIWCGVCGAGLCPGTTTKSPSRGNVNESFQVEPCQTCIERAHEEGRAEGYADGLAEGIERT